MFKRKVTAKKCFFNTGNGLKELEIGTIVETSNPDLFGGKAVTVQKLAALEVATPEPVPESGSELEAELRDFILEKSGQAAGGNSKLSTLKKRAKSLGWED